MAELGADYSSARPGGARIQAAGIKGVGRYLADDSRGITAAEYIDLKNYNIPVWLCREGAASGMLGGRAKGISDAQIAIQQIKLAGLPLNSAVFATADFDVQDSQFGVCDEYMRGFASVIGIGLTGIYGGLHYMNHVYDSKLATHFWQAGATSWDHRETAKMQISFRQTTLTPPLPGTDHNYIYTSTSFAGGGAVQLPNQGKDLDMPAVALHQVNSKPNAQGVVDQAYLEWTPFSLTVISFDYAAALNKANGKDPSDAAIQKVNENDIVAIRHSIASAIHAIPVPVIPPVSGGGSGNAPTAEENASAVKAKLKDDFAAIPKAVNDDAAKRLVQ